jgi:hypothetical protein
MAWKDLTQLYTDFYTGRKYIRVTQSTVDMGCNLWPLHQWDDATSPISPEELILWLYLLKVDEIWLFFLCSLQQTVKLPGSVWNSCAQYDAFVWRSGLMGNVTCLHSDVEPVGILLSSWQLQHVFFCWITLFFKNFSFRKKEMLKIQNRPFSFKFCYLNFLGKISTFLKKYN